MKKSIVLILFVVTAAACADRGATPRALLVNAAEKARQEKTARLQISTTTKFRLEVPGSSDLEYTTAGQGSFDFEHNVGQISFDFSEIIARSGQAGTQMPSKQNYVLGEDSVYIEVPEIARERAQGKSWLRIEIERIANATGLDVGSFGTSDPVKSLDYFKGILDKDIEEVGTERVHGVSTNHFRAKVSLDDLLKHVPETRREQVRQQMQSSEITEIPIDVWIDDDGLPRKWSIHIADAQGRFESTTTVDIDNYGGRVDITFPKEEDTFVVSSDEEMAEVLGYQPPR